MCAGSGCVYNPRPRPRARPATGGVGSMFSVYANGYQTNFLHLKNHKITNTKKRIEKNGKNHFKIHEKNSKF